MKQQIHVMIIEGASLFVHKNEEGEVTGINRELVPDEEVLSKPTVDTDTAIEATLNKSRVLPEAQHHESTGDGNNAFLTWTCSARYAIIDKDGNFTPVQYQLFAKASGDTPGLIQIRPLICRDNTPKMNTQDCENGKNKCDSVS